MTLSGHERDHETNQLCRQVEGHLAELIELDTPDPLLGADERRRLLEAASACERCRASLASYDATLRLLRALPSRPVPDDFLAWVERRVDLAEGAGATAARRRAAWFRVAGSLAAAGALFCGIVVWRWIDGDHAPGAGGISGAAPDAMLARGGERVAGDDAAPPDRGGLALRFDVAVPAARWREVDAYETALLARYARAAASPAVPAVLPVSAVPAVPAVTPAAPRPVTVESDGVESAGAARRRPARFAAAERSARVDRARIDPVAAAGADSAAPPSAAGDATAAGATLAVADAFDVELASFRSLVLEVDAGRVPELERELASLAAQSAAREKAVVGAATASAPRGGAPIERGRSRSEATITMDESVALRDDAGASGDAAPAVEDALRVHAEPVRVTVLVRFRVAGALPARPAVAPSAGRSAGD